MKRKLDQWADQIEAGLAEHEIAAVVTGGTVTPTRIAIDIMIPAPIPPQATLASLIGATLTKTITIEWITGGARAVMALPSPNDIGEIIERYRAHIPPTCAVLGLDDDGAPLLLRIPAVNIQHTLIIARQGRELLRAACYSLAVTNRREYVQIANFGLNTWGQPGQKLDQTLAAVVAEIDQRERAGAGLPVLIVAIPELARADPDSLTRILWKGAGVGIYCFAATAGNKSPGVFRTIIWGLKNGKYTINDNNFTPATIIKKEETR